MSIDNIEIGDEVSLKVPERGSRTGEVIGFTGYKLVVELTSGLTILVYRNELETEKISVSVLTTV